MRDKHACRQRLHGEFYSGKGWEKGGRNRGRETEAERQKEREMGGREEEEEMRGVCGVLPFKGTRLSACAQRPFSRSEY